MHFAKEIAQKKHLSDEEADILMSAALYHDIGKLFIPLEILEKPEKLTAKEIEIMRNHPRKAFDLIKEEMPKAAKVIVGHHEYQENPYPRKHPRDRCKLSQLLALADHYDAARSDRSYKDSMSKEDSDVVVTKVFGDDAITLVKELD
jgi:response regulator RpfG family c-di-GMP phosphodiesterase